MWFLKEKKTDDDKNFTCAILFFVSIRNFITQDAKVVQIACFSVIFVQNSMFFKPKLSNFWFFFQIFRQP